MVTGQRVRRQHPVAEAELREIINFFAHILKEFLVLQRRFPDVHVYIDTAESVPFLVIELDYDRLGKEDKDFLFGFGYRLNKAIQTVFGEDVPFVEVTILSKAPEGKNLTKII